MGNIIRIGMADLKASHHPAILTTLGLGSCVGIALYDRTTKIVGLAHAMLPDSSQVKNKTNAAKFVDTAIELLVKEMLSLGASKKRMSQAAGGAQMFTFTQGAELMRIGQRNVAAAKANWRVSTFP